ncbi:hypothetical protein H312_01274 [Anncaliia algerae PRA339]|uniref:Phosphatidic acid phosphatase type 2/haloperoxidase domain-containing protein n=1 Tax=Anncaliia algerae PRA339 TaxID=1288291 RepID=A0A059F1V8_9MICR|nr:hypothetical protein H312_01274 [Anncaliia algerae PRA339]
MKFIATYLLVLLLIILSPFKTLQREINDNLLEIFYKKYSSLIVFIIHLLSTKNVLHNILTLILFIPLPEKKNFSGHVYKTILTTYFLRNAYKNTKKRIIVYFIGFIIAFINFYVLKTIFYYHSKIELFNGWLIGLMILLLINLNK